MTLREFDAHVGALLKEFIMSQDPEAEFNPGVIYSVIGCLRHHGTRLEWVMPRCDEQAKERKMRAAEFDDEP